MPRGAARSSAERWVGAPFVASSQVSGLLEVRKGSAPDSVAGSSGRGNRTNTECTMTDSSMPPLTADDLAAEGGTALPDKEVISLLDLNADLNLGLDAAAPIDLAVAANANVAAPIDAAVGANVLSLGSEAQALAHQGVAIDQGLTGEAVAHGGQTSTIDQGTHAAPAAADPGTAPADAGTAPADATAPTDG